MSFHQDCEEQVYSWGLRLNCRLLSALQFRLLDFEQASSSNLRPTVLDRVGVIITVSQDLEGLQILDRELEEERGV